MEMFIIYVLLIVLLLGIIWHIFVHLMAVFDKDTTNIVVKKVLEDPYKYIKQEEMCYILRNMVYFVFVCLLLFAACDGNIKICENANGIKQVKISNIKE